MGGFPVLGRGTRGLAYTIILTYKGFLNSVCLNKADTMQLILEYLAHVKQADELDEHIAASQEQPAETLQPIFEAWSETVVTLHDVIARISDAPYSEDPRSEYQILRRCAYFRNKIARAVHHVIVQKAKNKHDIQMAIGLYYGVPQAELTNQTHDGCLLQLLRDKHVAEAVAAHSHELHVWAIRAVNVLEKLPVWEAQPQDVRAEIFLTETFRRTTSLFNRLALWVAPRLTAEVLLQFHDERREQAYLHLQRDLKFRETMALRQKPQ